MVVYKSDYAIFTARNYKANPIVFKIDLKAGLENASKVNETELAIPDFIFW